MKKESYDEIVKTISNPDTLAEGIVKLREQIDADVADYNALLNSRDTLRDTNAKLALRITNDVSIKSEPQLSKEEKTQKFIDKFYV